MPGAAPQMMNPHANPLAQLKDIHLPAPVDAWPPAPGWFILAALIIAGVVGATWYVIHYWNANRYRREALQELERLRADYREANDTAAYLQAYAALLKRTALTRYPRAAVANLTGEAWVDFLDRTARTDEFSMGAGQVLIQGNYQPRPEENVDVTRLHDIGRHWIRRHRKLERAA
ncbi:MAG TPA: DUF4381 domain-containing protein [Pseudomonadales bacterium]|nr:DUF4381 domain-containing protein [Pseudomonadales bacterium]